MISKPFVSCGMVTCVMWARHRRALEILYLWCFFNFISFRPNFSAPSFVIPVTIRQAEWDKLGNRRFDALGLGVPR